ncbi:GATA transcription factor 5 [Manihot esculenta]|uniref:GATA-type domain-containing protein n=1 Tax=Manihot esculenta TaxID=3983 RepID=A0A251KNK5_MANES|nr:GATA transcription factor 5 [Manihot esculenta]XP_021622846.1 GATA transcription factor 5 [Manihot esculenta]OAY41953.1 hypothetical protein MANES_09G142600v8 [Manihot esculenta]OAY41954.1 hypothetical protein MANES_09G142600v8 [Manihot esculenta]OAY41955.1 hypothetical protein MANES_09G142600v8 [Manihot esculenta]
MDFYRNVTICGEYHQQEQVLPSPSPCSKLGTAIAPTSPLDDLFSAQNTEVDVSLEWLSVFVEDCLSSTGNCLPAPTSSVQNKIITPNLPKSSQRKPLQNSQASLERFVIPGKARSKRKRVTSVKTRNPLSSWSQILHFPSSDPPLLQQAYWLADSELIMPQKERTTSNSSNTKTRDSEEEEEEETREEEQEQVTGVSNNGKEGVAILESSSGQQQQPRRCSHCLAQRTPQWRAGPLGPKTLCNACGVRYKSGRLLPEYRPAKSPTFVSYLHSNSHKKVMEMRTAGSAVFNSY